MHTKLKNNKLPYKNQQTNYKVKLGCVRNECVHLIRLLIAYRGALK